MPTRFRVWDKLNETEKEAREIDSDSPEAAAETYAEQDVDGQIGCIYEDGHALMVKVTPEEVYECIVKVEYTHHYDVLRRAAP